VGRHHRRLRRVHHFNRIVDHGWQNNYNSTPVDIDRYQYGYDRNSNRQYKANVVGTAVVTARSGRVLYLRSPQPA